MLDLKNGRARSAWPRRSCRNSTALCVIYIMRVCVPACSARASLPVVVGSGRGAGSTPGSLASQDAIADADGEGDKSTV